MKKYIFIYEMNNKEFTDIKIRKIYRDILKRYAEKYGYKMYAVVEQLIEQHCDENSNLLKSKNDKSY